MKNAFLFLVYFFPLTLIGQEFDLSKGKIEGVILDQENEIPVPFTTILLFSIQDSSLVEGAMSNEEGEFVLETLPGIFWIEVQSLGYKPEILEAFRLSKKDGTRKNLGSILIEKDIEYLDIAEIEGEQKFMEWAPDRKIYNVDKITTASGASANEILQELPSIDVDIDGKISLRGSENVNILIDGRPSSLSGADRESILEQLPASAIEKIEVITNPSAKFDPDGMAGIINIVLKKNKLQGIHGNVQMNVGTGDIYSGRFSINRKSQKLNLSSNYGFRYNDSFQERLTDRVNTIEDYNEYLNQIGDGNRIRLSHNFGLGADYEPSLGNIFSINLKGNLSGGDEIDSLSTELNDSNQNIIQDYRRFTDGENQRNSFDVSLGFKKEFERGEHELEVLLAHSAGNSDNMSEFIQENTVPVDLEDLMEDNRQSNADQNGIFSIDYFRPLGESWKVETGAKATERKLDNDQEFYSVNSTSELVLDSLRSNRFKYGELILAYYAQAARKYGSWGFQGGVRAEQAYTQSDLITTGETFNNDYFSLYPSAFVTYEMNKEHQFNASYSRRVNRPRSRHLNPFTDFSDPLNLRTGNPFLNPEYINSYEIGYQGEMGKSILSSSIYLKDVNDVIRRFKTVDSTGVSRTTYENIAGSIQMGIEGMLNYRPNKKMRINASFNAYRTSSDGSNIESDLSNDAFSWNAKTLLSYSHPKDWQTQVSGRYRARLELLQGVIQPIATVDIAVKKSILNNKGNLTFQVRDVFNTREFNFDSFGENFTQDSYRKRESRNFFINFSYNFGKLEEKGNRRKSGSNSQGDNRDDEIELE